MSYLATVENIFTSRLMKNQFKSLLPLDPMQSLTVRVLDYELQYVKA